MDAPRTLHGRIGELLLGQHEKLLELEAEVDRELTAEREKRIAAEIRIAELEQTVAAVGKASDQDAGNASALRDVDRAIAAVKAMRAAIPAEVALLLTDANKHALELLRALTNLKAGLTGKAVDNLPGRILRGPFQLINGGRP